MGPTRDRLPTKTTPDTDLLPTNSNSLAGFSRVFASYHGYRRWGRVPGAPRCASHWLRTCPTLAPSGRSPCRSDLAERPSASTLPPKSIAYALSSPLSLASPLRSPTPLSPSLSHSPQFFLFPFPFFSYRILHRPTLLVSSGLFFGLPFYTPHSVPFSSQCFSSFFFGGPLVRSYSYTPVLAFPSSPPPSFVIALFPSPSALNRKLRTRIFRASFHARRVTGLTDVSRYIRRIARIFVDAASSRGNSLSRTPSRIRRSFYFSRAPLVEPWQPKKLLSSRLIGEQGETVHFKRRDND